MQSIEPGIRDWASFAPLRNDGSQYAWPCSLPCSSAPDRDCSRSCRAVSAKSLRSCADRHDRISCSLRNRRGISSSYSALPLRVMRKANSRRSSSFSTRSTSCRCHQRRDGAADGGFMGAGAMRDVLRAAGVVAETERRQHPPFRNIQPVALLIFAGQRGADLGRQPVQPERHEPEEIEPGGFFGRAFFPRTASSPDASAFA